MKIKMLTVGPIGTNCYILEDEKNKLAAVIDPGDEAPKIKKVLDQDGMTTKYILLTHGHYDHTTGVPELERLLDYQVAIYIHKADANGTGNTLFPLAGQVDGLNYYDEGDHITFGDLDIEVLHTPGHSEGSVTLKVQDVLFCGDTLFAGSCGRTDFPGGNVRKMMASLRRLAQLEGDYTVCPGHMNTSTLERERVTNPYMMQAMEG